MNAKGQDNQARVYTSNGAGLTLGPVVQLVKTSPSQLSENGGDPRFEPGRAHHAKVEASLNF